MSITGIDYSALPKRPKPSKKEPLLVAAISTVTIFVILAVYFIIMQSHISTELIEDAGGLLLLVMMIFFVMYAIKTIFTKKISHHSLYMEFIKDNHTILTDIPIDPSNQLFESNSLVLHTPTRIFYKHVRPECRREFAFSIHLNGLVVSLYNAAIYGDYRGTRYDPYFRVIEIRLPEDNTYPRTISCRKPIDFVEALTEGKAKRRYGLDRAGLIHENFLSYIDGTISPQQSILLHSILASIQDPIGWDTVELVDNTVYLFGYKRIHYDQDSFMGVLAQADITTSRIAATLNRI